MRNRNTNDYLLGATRRGYLLGHLLRELIKVTRRKGASVNTLDWIKRMIWRPSCYLTLLVEAGDCAHTKMVEIILMTIGTDVSSLTDPMTPEEEYSFKRAVKSNADNFIKEVFPPN